jgi:branched-subunit amino acid ABC-type transport system permease component
MQYLVNGIVVGCIIVLGSTGFTTLYALLGFPNLAYGEIMLLGAYVTLTFNALGVPVYVALLLAIPVTCMATVVVDRLVFKKLRHANLSTLIMASFGIALFLRSLIRVIWGTGVHLFSMGPTPQLRLPFGAVITVPQLFIIGYSTLLVVLLAMFRKKTKLGKATRAVADNRTLALVTGIGTEKIILWNLIIGGVLAVSGGVFLGIDSSLNPLQGWRLLLPVYAATSFGKVGSMYGALGGGLLLGLAQELSAVYLSTEYKPGIALLAIILTIFIRFRLFRKG